MSELDFIKKLYNGKNCYSDHMGESELRLLHISSKAEDIIVDMIAHGKIVFLTGNPGDGKTFIIKAIRHRLDEDVYIQTDLNNIKDYSEVVKDLIALYSHKKPAIIAVNEYPFMQLCRQLRKESRTLYNEIQNAKRNVLAYDISSPLYSSIAVVDLNERNMLGADYNLLSGLLDKMVSLLEEAARHNSTLSYNLKAFKNDFVRNQILSLFQLAAAECEHFAVRDILGAFSFIFTACTTEEYSGSFYFTAIFEGTNELLKTLQQFDPLLLSQPSLDEALWNGEVTEGWIFDIPEHSPVEIEDVDEAYARFQTIKRQYYFENVNGKKLAELQPDEIKECTSLFTDFAARKKKIKGSLIRSINKLFLPSSDDRKQLHIWTTHKYDMSQEAAVAVSSKAIDAAELEIQMPRPADWLTGLEYVPDHLILKPKNADIPRLVLNIDFLRTLNAVEKGYPIGLLAPRYEQAASMFLQQLDDDGFSEANEDGEIIIASRNKSYKRIIHIQNGRYDFEEEN